jgi:hypothetical protein
MNSFAMATNRLRVGATAALRRSLSASAAPSKKKVTAMELLRMRRASEVRRGEASHAATLVNACVCWMPMPHSQFRW